MTPFGKVQTLALLLCAGVSLLVGQSTSKTPAGPAESVTPIEFIQNKPYVMVMVNGHGPYRFLIDTGTGARALISPELVRELEIPKVGHAHLTDPSRQGEQRSDVVWIDSLKIGNVEFEEVEAVEHRLFREEQNCQGVLGFPLFEDYLLTLDFPGRRMILSSGIPTEQAGASSLPFRIADGVPITKMEIDGVSVDAQIDSGGTGLSIPASIAEHMKFESVPVAFGVGESLTTRFTLTASRLQLDVQFGPYVFRKPFVEINPAFPLVNLGSTPLKNFVITFDQQEGVMLVLGRNKVLPLDASPALMQMQNEPRRQASDTKLVPVG